jgi:hypothetical protein
MGLREYNQTMQNEDVKVTDATRAAMVNSQSSPRMVDVKVLAENGIFKNGRHYEKNEVATIEMEAAKRFQDIGDVIITDETEVGNV